MCIRDRAYIMSRDVLLDLLERCDSAMNRRFHRDGLGGLMELSLIHIL